HSECKVFVVQGGIDKADGKEFPWIDMVNGMKKNLTTVEKYVSFGFDAPKYDGYIDYESALAAASPEEPSVNVSADDIWVIMYTVGTTGKPKGVMKSHASLFAEYFITIYDHQFTFDDLNLLVMPCCHVNSLYYSFVVTWIGAAVAVYNMVSFNPEELLRTFHDLRVTFTSLVPTHYIMMLTLPDEIKQKYDLSSIRKLLISSAPARKDTKIGVLEMFKNAELYEAYGSTEAGIVTVLKPSEQITKIGTIGREVIGTDIIRLYDEDENLITDSNVVGELYSRSPMLFEGYWKEPDRTAASMIGEYFSAGDMAYRDEDGYYVLVDRKANMINSGGENIYPSEVETVLGSNPKIQEVAVIGVPHEKWGEQVTAIIVLRQGEKATVEEIQKYCKGKIASYKVPKAIVFIAEHEVPRSATGKVLHRALREKYGKK
ncbi:MAG TPA: AMP-binding protein, partial [Syntrophorhabdaceae bacterium]|nr:AMP-binding protein [Syntrophorhabdaceae bacterium]